jgi:hypothetical protein
LLAAGIAAALLVPAAASANTITVNSIVDPSASSPACTLHDAITAANTNAVVNGCAAGSGITTDTIDFSLPNPSTITLAGALPSMTSNMDITGPGMSQLTVSGNDSVRPFQNNSISVDSISAMTISHGASLGGGAINNTGTLTLTDVSVSANAASAFGGVNAFPQGGGILNSGTLHLILSTVSGNTAGANGATSQNAPAGAGIYSQGTLTLDRSTVSGNSLIAIASGTATTNASGGGIQNGGSLTATRSTISGNTVSASGSTAANSGAGGGVSTTNGPGVTMTLDRSTVADNLVAVQAPSFVAGGGIQSAGTSGSSLTVTSSTISGNTASLSANLQYGAATTAIKNTIIANPLGGNSCSAAVSVSQGYNIDSANTCGFNQSTDQHDTDPLLASSLANNGGPTQTLLPQPNSLAIDKGLSSGGETIDQRGSQRPWLFDIADASGGDGTDIGAVEVQGPVPTGTTPTSPGASGSPNVFGTVESGSTVKLFNDASCGVLATSGPAATFASPGLTGGPVPAATSITFSVRSTYGTATSVCSPTTIDYTNSSTPPPPSSGGGGGSASPVAPDTSLSARVRKRKHKATFTFGSSDPSSTFMCKLDKRALAPCTSPVTFKHLRKGRHTFTVEAVNGAGADPSPATFKFKLKR